MVQLIDQHYFCETFLLFVDTKNKLTTYKLDS